MVAAAEEIESNIAPPLDLDDACPGLFDPPKPAQVVVGGARSGD